MLHGRKVIALCIANAGDNRHFSFISSLNKVLRGKGCKLFIYHTCTDFYHQKQCEEGEKAVFDLMDYSYIDAVVLFCESFKDSALLEHITETARSHNTPVISVGEQRPDAMTLMFDYENGFEAVVRHVIETHGIKDTCMIAGVEGEYHSEHRIEVYKKVLEDNGLCFEPSQLYYGDYWWGPTRRAVQSMLVAGKLPKAIICANDSMAIAACEELKANGYSVPEQVVVTGFDGTLEAQYNKPPITTAKCDMNLAAKGLADVLDKLFAKQPVPPVYEVPYVPDIYKSCGCNKRAHHAVNVGERMKWAEDRFIKYQDDERTLMEVSEQILGCESPDQFEQCLKQFPFYNVSIVLNTDCLDEKISPASGKRKKSFDNIMQVIYRTETEHAVFPEEMPRKNLLPDLEGRMWQEGPLLFTALSFLGEAFGYLYFGSFQAEEYSKILQYVKTLSNAFGTYRMIKNLKYTATSMERMSRTDYLTGLYNRTGFYAELPALEKEAKGKYIMVASLDVDNLKRINDQFGHAAGDFVIKAVAEAMEAIPFERKICGRFGGDEMVLCVVADTVAEESLLRSRIEKHLQELNLRSGRPYVADASIGVVTVRAEAFDMSIALKRSDQVMYENKIKKKAGRS